MNGGCLEGSAPVDILEAHDVVLAQVAARLHLDDLERHLAGVGQAVAAGYNIRWLMRAIVAQAAKAAKAAFLACSKLALPAIASTGRSRT